MNPVEARTEIDASIEAGNALAASHALAELWASEKTPSSAAFVVSRFEQLRPNLSLSPYRVALLRSFTVEPIVSMLRAAAFCAGIDLAVYLSEFNTYAQEILDPASTLYQFKPDAAILVVQTRDVAPELWRGFTELDELQIEAAINHVATDFGSWIHTFRKHSSSALIVHNLEQPALPAFGILDQFRNSSQRLALEKINAELRAVASENQGTYLLDYDALIARHGRDSWHDERRWLSVRLPIAGNHLNDLVGEWMRFLHPLTGKIAKCLVVDLDNTLWGGVIGEDGINGIRLGTEYPGAAYQDVQRALLDLRRRGILLAICSKNNADDALEAIRNHSGMKLKTEDFAAMRINWADKSQNIREIAAELNIGIDSLAFLDDNPIERRHVRAALPEVFVLELPHDAMQFARSIRECPLFERLSLSAEDQRRGEMYQQQRERMQLEQQTSSREDFYRSLQQEAEIAPVTPATLARVAQLTQKTNQFNLTTRRYAEQQIKALTTQAGWQCFSLRVRDRFGDNGLVGVAITHVSGEQCEIDTLLMSCRVIGRTIETAFLAFLADQAQRLGACELQGWYLPTKKNSPARDFYSNHGFREAQRDGDSVLWSLDLTNAKLATPDWVSLQVLEGELK